MRTVSVLLAVTMASTAILPLAEPHAQEVDALSSRPGPVEQVRLTRGDRSLSVTWRSAPTPVRNYRVQISVSGGQWTRAATTTRTSAKLAGLRPVRTRVRVRVWDGSRFGRWSTPVAITPADPAFRDRRFRIRAPGATLVGGRACASRVRPAREIRPANTRFNQTRGTSRNDAIRRVNGNFVGTTDEVLQWAACKWGAPENIVRAQAANESWWDQRAAGDLTTEKASCHRSLRKRTPCPQSIGLFQILYRVHPAAYEDRNAILSSAYNADYLWGLWRSCFEGEMTWLNAVERGRRYEAGDRWGCVGVMNTGRWYTKPSKAYIKRIKAHLEERTWKQPAFVGAAAAGVDALATTDIDELGIRAAGALR